MAESLVVQPSEKTAPPPPAPNDGRVPMFQKVAWGIGGITDNVVANGIANMGLLVYNVGMGVNVVWITIAMAIPRFFDAFIDPFVGNFSDNARTPWGRRWPFIVLGAILASLFFAWVWFPPLALMGRGLMIQMPGWLVRIKWLHVTPELNVPHLFWFFLLMSMLYYFGYALFTITLGALGYEMSTDYHERTRIQAWKAYFANGSGLILPVMPQLMINAPDWVKAHAIPWPHSHLAQNFMAAHPHLPNLIAKSMASLIGMKDYFYSHFHLPASIVGLFVVPAGIKPEVIGIRYVGILVALILVVAGVIPGLCCRERVQPQAHKLKIGRALKLTLSNRPFLILIGVIFTVLLGLFMVMPLAGYINIYYVCRGDEKAAYGWIKWIGWVYAVMGVVVIPLITYLGVKLGKRGAMLFAQISVVLASLSSWWLFTPNHPAWQILQPMMMCPGLSCLWLLSGSMVADICDVDELNNGTRREGMFGAVFVMFIKYGIASVTILSGLIVAVSGYNPKLNLQSEWTITFMRIAFALVPALCLMVAVGLTSIFPITEKSAREVRAQLDARKKAAAS